MKINTNRCTMARFMKEIKLATQVLIKIASDHNRRFAAWNVWT